MLRIFDDMNERIDKRNLWYLRRPCFKAGLTLKCLRFNYDSELRLWFLLGEVIARM